MNDSVTEIVSSASMINQKEGENPNKETSEAIKSGQEELKSTDLASNRIKEQIVNNQADKKALFVVSDNQIENKSMEEQTSNSSVGSQILEQQTLTMEEEASHTAVVDQDTSNIVAYNQQVEHRSNVVSNQLEDQTSKSLGNSQHEQHSFCGQHVKQLLINLEGYQSEEKKSSLLVNNQPKEQIPSPSKALDSQLEQISSASVSSQQQQETPNIAVISPQEELSPMNDEQPSNFTSMLSDPFVHNAGVNAPRTILEKKIMHSPELPNIVKPGDTIKLITVLDTGGQPEYVMLLPAINSMPTINFIVHDLTKKLEEPVLVQYKKGDVEFSDYTLEYSNLDMIHLLLCLITDSLEQTPQDVPQCITAPEKSRIGFVGTHYDKIKHKFQVLQEVNNQLKSIMDKRKCKLAFLTAADDSIIFPVDNTASGDASREGEAVKLIREHVEDIAEEMKPNELPIKWMILELQMQVLRVDEKRKYITYEYYKKTAKEIVSITDEKEIKASLQYFHILGVVLYFDVAELNNWVIIDLAWLFTNLGKIMRLSSENVRILEYSLKERFNKQKLLAKKLARRISLEGMCDEREIQYFIKTLIHLKVIAIVAIEQVEYYYLSCALPSAMHYNDNCRFLLSEPLLIQFSSGFLPRGFFCSLVASLLNDMPESWEHQLTNTTTKHYSNVITFCISDEIYFRMHDKTYYLELQARHFSQDVDTTQNSEIVPTLIKHMKLVCDQLNFDYDKLQYGFLCHVDCKYSTDDHIAIVKYPDFPLPHILKCTRNPPHKTKTGKSHRIWFKKVVKLFLLLHSSTQIK